MFDPVSEKGILKYVKAKIQWGLISQKWGVSFEGIRKIIDNEKQKETKNES